MFTRSPEEDIACTNDVMNILGCKTVEDLNNVDVSKILQASVVLGLRVWAEMDGKILPVDSL